MLNWLFGSLKHAAVCSARLFVYIVLLSCFTSCDTLFHFIHDLFHIDVYESDK